MIYALDDKNERISASDSEKGKSYVCPNLECENRELILKKGRIRIPHFAHKSKHDCSSEPESEAHISCKQYFQSLLELDKQFVEYYGIEGVRPDVLYNQFALEIQCSPITSREINRRNSTYKKNGYRAIWIFLEDTFTPTKKTVIIPEKSERDKKLERYGIRPETPIELEPKYRITNVVKKQVFEGSFHDIEEDEHKFFSFKYENGDVRVKFVDAIISTKQDFDNTLDEVLLFVKKKKEWRELKKKIKKIGKELNSLPQQIQANLYDISGLNYPDISGRYFIHNEGNRGPKIGHFILEMYSGTNYSLDEFKEYIEKMVIKAYEKDKSFKDWRDRCTLKRKGKIYVPLCKKEKINHETNKAYLVLGTEWIPKSLTYIDDKYIYCEEWRFKKIRIR